MAAHLGVSGWYGSPGARGVLFTWLAYLWALISERLSCEPTMSDWSHPCRIGNQTLLPNTSVLCTPPRLTWPGRESEPQSPAWGS